jgi:cation/acetate symporter
MAKVAEAQAAVAAAGGDAAPAEIKAAAATATADLTKFQTANAHWWGIKNVSCGLFGIPVAFIVTWVVSRLTPAPSQEMQDFIDSIRVPRGAVLQTRGSAAVE